MLTERNSTPLRQMIRVLIFQRKINLNIRHKKSTTNIFHIPIADFSFITIHLLIYLPKFQTI